VIKHDPSEAWVFNARANAYAMKGDPDHAIADYTEILKLDPKDADA